MNAGQQPPRKNKRDIFLGALDHPTPVARAAYLDGACGKDLALRAAVEALLQNLEQDSFLESPAVETRQVTAASGPGGTLIVGMTTEKPGDRIGRYKLLQQIGEGGCGVVYMADQEEPVKRRVALKVIKPGMDTREVLGRFEAERQALALMDHSNIAKVLDAGATETGRPYFVMELVRGIPITRYCDEHKLNTGQRLELFMQVCQAIQHAHQKGIIHRDIKPSNILVADHDGVPVPKIIDFGIAKATSGQTLTDKTVFTALEQFIGTPAYMSPEQANLSGLDIDTRSDIYSLGVLLYELLTGKTPFDARKLFEAGFDEIRRIIREEEPPRPSQKLSTLAAEEQTTAAQARQTDSPRLLHLVRGDLDWIVMKCLEKDRNRRYETANGLASDLLRHINNEPVLARPPSNVYRFQKMVRRNKLAFAAAVAVALALLLGVVVSSWQAGRARQAERHEATLQIKAQDAEKRVAAALKTEAELAFCLLTNSTSLPKSPHTKQSWTVIIQYGKLYSLEAFSTNGNGANILNKRDLLFQGPSHYVDPIPGQGEDPESGVKKIVQDFEANARTNYYFAFLVYDDSWEAFARALETARGFGYQCVLQPLPPNQRLQLVSHEEHVTPQN